MAGPVTISGVVSDLIAEILLELLDPRSLDAKAGARGRVGQVEVWRDAAEGGPMADVVGKEPETLANVYVPLDGRGGDIVGVGDAEVSIDVGLEVTFGE